MSYTDSGSRNHNPGALSPSNQPTPLRHVQEVPTEPNTPEAPPPRQFWPAPGAVPHSQGPPASHGHSQAYHDDGYDDAHGDPNFGSTYMPVAPEREYPPSPGGNSHAGLPAGSSQPPLTSIGPDGKHYPVIPPIPAGPYSRPASEAPQYARPSSQQSTYSYTNPAQNPAGGSSQNHQRSTSLNNPPTNAGSTPGPRSRLVPQTSRTSLNSTGSHNHWEQDKYLDPAYLAAGATGGEDSVAGKGKQREDGAGWPQYFHRE